MKTIATAATTSNLFGSAMHVAITVNSGNGWAQATIHYDFKNASGSLRMGMIECDEVFTDNRMDRCTYNAIRRALIVKAAELFERDNTKTQVLGNCVYDLVPAISAQLLEYR